MRTTKSPSTRPNRVPFEKMSAVPETMSALVFVMDESKHNACSSVKDLFRNCWRVPSRPSVCPPGRPCALQAVRVPSRPSVRPPGA